MMNIHWLSQWPGFYPVQLLVAKMGVLGASTSNNHVSSDIELYDYNSISIYDQEAD